MTTNEQKSVVAAHDELLAQLKAERAAYHEAANVETAPKLAERWARIKSLMEQMDALLCAGAKPCPKCGEEPYGRLMRPAHVHRGAAVSAVYAVQCNSRECQKAGLLSVGQTPEVAVFAWNQGAYGR